MELDGQIAQARADGDRDRLADLLVKRANEHAKAGRLADAQQDLDEAAGIHHDAERPIDEARCLVFAATLCRARAELEEGERRARRAEEIAPPETPARVSAATELGENAILRGNFAYAVDCYTHALEHGIPAGLTPFHQAALLRKRAQALAAVQRVSEAIDDLVLAREHYRKNDEGGEDRKTGVELATALQLAGRKEDLDAVLGSLRASAQAEGDGGVLADIELLAAARALDAGDRDGAIAAASRAREHALSAVVPTAYVGAAVTIAELEEAAGNRVAAYASLAKGWATLGDLLGEEVARATFAPKLSAQRERWGDEAFVEARDAYYAQRKQAPSGD